MKKRLIWLFIISLTWGGLSVSYAQDSTTTKGDSIYYQERYGVRVGLDLSKPLRSFIDDKYEGLEVLGDYRLLDRIYLAGELGYEKFDTEEDNFSANSDGSYFKVGVNYNAYTNWLGMQNEVYAGLRYGFSTFSQTLYDYSIFDRDHYFPTESVVSNQKFKGLNAHWVELQIGVKAEILNNLYLGIHVETKRLISSKEPDNFANLWMPGFNRHYEDTEFGVGWGYSISYLIPITKKLRKQKAE